MPWAARFLRQAVRKLRPAARRKPRHSLRIESLEVRVVPHVSGTVFIDLNQDGFQDADDVGVAGVVVAATDDTGAAAQVTTDENGMYELEIDAEKVRLEFSKFPDGTLPGRAVGTSGPAVRFLTADSERMDQNLSLSSPMLVTTQFYYDRSIDGMNADFPAVMAVPYGTQDIAFPVSLATVAEVGSVWGVAYQPQSNNVYVSSFVKRHAGLGPNAAGTGTTTGAIYRVDRSTDPATVSLLIDLNTAGTAFATGADPHPALPEFDGGNWFRDAATLPLVGKRGLGGLQASPDGRTLYTVNLATRELIEIPINAEGEHDTTRPLRRTPVPLGNPAGSGISGFNAANLRPFAVAVKDSTVYVGVTYTAETGGGSASLRAFVYAFNPTTGTFTSPPVLSANLNYPRGAADDPTPDEPGDEVSANWRPWIATFDMVSGQEGLPVHPQPWLTDIVFDGNTMVLAIRDRFGDQGGFQTGAPAGGLPTGDDLQFSVIAVGDILRASPKTSGGWQMESGGVATGMSTGGAGSNQGPGGGEFYFQDAADFGPQEVITGGLAQVPGFQTLAATGNDALSPFSGGIYTFFNSDTDPDPETNTAGAAAVRGEVYSSFDMSTFGSANGLGDLEAIPFIGTVEAGDRLFEDTNQDGMQDPGEPGIEGVVIRVFQGNTELDSVTTGANGEFLVGNLLPNTAYQLRIDTTQPALGGRTLALANRGSNDSLDSDVTLTGTTAIAPFTTGMEGSSIHALDAGFIGPLQTGNLTLGDTVFRDANNNGTLDTGETGVAGVTVELLDATGANVLETTATDSNGIYTFVALEPGNYRVRLAASNFSGSGALVNFTSSTSTATDPNNDQDNNDDGDVSGGTLGNGGFIVSGSIGLADGTEPINDGDNDANTNMTLDFGVVATTPVGNMSLGNQVFRDANNNGTLDTGETGVAGVLLELLDQGGTPIAGQTATTNASGIYTFIGLAPGTYRVRIAASNFIGTGPLVGLRSSDASSSDPNDNVNDNDDGSESGTLGANGFIVTQPITLTQDGEPIDDGDTDANSNLTLDFGVVQPVAGPLTLGNLVWNDANDNGTFDTGETGINGVTVQLLNPAGTVVSTATTANGGLYTFANLAAGDYRVRLVESNFQTGGALVNFTSSTPTATDPDDDVNDNDDGAVTGTLGQAGGFIQSGLITLVADAEPTNDGDADANTNLTLDFGVRATAATGPLTLGDRVFRDANNNGQLDTGEVGLSGVTVQLINAQGNIVGTTTTNGTGNYTFATLAAGDYRVRLAEANFQVGGALFGFSSSTSTAADPDDNVNNNDDGAPTGTLGQAGGFIQSGLITLTAGGEPTNDGDTNNNTNLTLDFGVVPSNLTLTLGNTVWNDVNNNGLLDTGENGISGVTVQLVNAAGTVLNTATTNASGQYTFANLSAGDYRIRLAASNFTGTGPLVGFTSSTGTNGALTGPFEGTATPDPDTNANNDDNGNVSGTLGGTGFIETGLITLSQNTEPTNDGDVDPNTNLTLDVGVFRKFSVGNLVFNDLNNNGAKDTNENGMPGVTVRLLNADLANAVVGTQTTNAQGLYLFTNLLPGNYIVELAATNFNTGGSLFSFQSSTGTGNAFEPPPAGGPDNQDHGTTSGTLGGGGTVQSGTLAIGPGMPTGESPNNDATTPDNQSNLAIDFGLFQQTPATSSISGRVFMDFNNSGAFNSPDFGLQGVVLTLSGGGLTNPITVQTDVQGNFTFTNLAAGTYSLSEAQPNSPANQTGKDRAGTAGGSTAVANTISGIVLGANAQATGYTFAEVPLLSTGGSVYEDQNGNGLKDSGEPGISGVIITLNGTSVVDGTISPRSVLTDTSGNYTFNNVTPGTYSITETQPAGFVDGREQNGTPAAATVTNDRFGGINLATAATSGGFNFGEVEGASIAGVVYDDVNDDGAQATTGEVGISGVAIRLMGTNDLGQAINRTTTTGTDGTYSFTGLRPGTYRLIETQPALYKDGKETAGTSAGNATAVNNQITNIQLTSGATATGYLFGEHATADMIVTMTPGSANVAPGGTVTITYTVRNRGTASAAGVEVNINYGGMVFVSSPSPDFDNTTRKWTVGDVAAGATETITIVLRAPLASTFAPSARVITTSPELLTTNNIDSSVISATGSTPTPPPSPGTPLGSLWFLSSSTNARRTPR